MKSIWSLIIISSHWPQMSPNSISRTQHSVRWKYSIKSITVQINLISFDKAKGWDIHLLSKSACIYPNAAISRINVDTRLKYRMNIFNCTLSRIHSRTNNYPITKCEHNALWSNLKFCLSTNLDKNSSSFFATSLNTNEWFCNNVNLFVILFEMACINFRHFLIIIYWGSYIAY